MQVYSIYLLRFQGVPYSYFKAQVYTIQYSCMDPSGNLDLKSEPLTVNLRRPGTFLGSIGGS